MFLLLLDGVASLESQTGKPHLSFVNKGMQCKSSDLIHCVYLVIVHLIHVSNARNFALF